MHIVSYGEALWDLRPDGPVPGGAPMNVALRLARLGQDVTLVSRVGNDEPGRRLLDYLSRENLDTRAVQVDPAVPTGSVFVDVSNPHEVRYDIVAPAAWDFIEIDDTAAKPDVVVFGSLAARNGHSRQNLLLTLNASRLKVFDVNLRAHYDDRKIIEMLLARADWAKLNEHELRLIAGWHGGGTTLRDAMERVAGSYGLDTVCVTLGPHGAAMLSDGHFILQSGFEVEVVDTIGCGDSFLACWLAELLADRPPEDALRRACAMGAIVATREGANPPVTPEAVRALAGC